MAISGEDGVLEPVTSALHATVQDVEQESQELPDSLGIVVEPATV